MIIRSIIALIIFVAFFNDQIATVTAMSPYSILGVSRTATDKQIEAQYRKMRSKHRRSRLKKNMVRQAYDQIMVERKFNQRNDPSNVDTSFTPAKPKVPQVINE